jgi:Zn-dependent M28 family amino/carboxypeptidase
MEYPDRKVLKTRIFTITISIIVLATALSLWFLSAKDRSPQGFDANLAYQHVIEQMEFGPRIPGSEAHANAVAYIQSELEKNDWTVEIQNAEALGHPLVNVIGKRGSGSEWIILGAHYDSRFYADHDPDLENHSLPVPGANDGASGVAVLLELARVLPEDLNREVWLVFFDLEDQGRIEGWDWILGSKAFVQELEGTPDAVVIVDMVGDRDLNIHREKSSDTELTDEIWQIAANLGYADYFLDDEKYAILDDHSPFLSAGIKAIDIIDFDYTYWHTVHDTADKVAPESLKTVGDVLLEWLTK